LRRASKERPIGRPQELAHGFSFDFGGFAVRPRFKKLPKGADREYFTAEDKVFPSPLIRSTVTGFARSAWTRCAEFTPSGIPATGFKKPFHGEDQNGEFR
jgi:hypothetical protein